MAKADDQNQDGVDPKDLDLVDDALEDEGKERSELWSEFDQAETGEPAEASTEKSDDDTAASSEETTSDDDAGADDGQEAAGQDDREDGGDPPADADPWAKAPAEVRAAHEAAERQWEERDKRLRGQVSHLERRLRELSQTPATPKGDAGKGKQGADDDRFKSEKWKAFAGEFPEVAGPLQDELANLHAVIAKQSKELDAIGSDRRDAALNEQKALFEKEHPDWRTVVADADLVEGWLLTQPRHIREAAARNATEIVDAAEAADVISRFKVFRSGQGDGTQAPATDTSKAGDAGKDTGKPRLNGRRQRQLEAASGTRAGGPGVAHGIPEDGDRTAIWKAFDKLEAKRPNQRA